MTLTAQNEESKLPRTTSHLFDSVNQRRLMRWLLAGLAFMGVNAVLLYLLVDFITLSVPIATLISAEACTLLRYFVNHYWVFGRQYPTLKECVHYHVANLLALVTWWIVANALTLAGLHYQLSSIAALTVSTLVSLATNFLWIWRHRDVNEVQTECSRMS